jgi:pyruvate/2-oxoglutarate dehydrogenase complex dihydrolipoamide dehydrogenase (E3) component
MMSQSERYEMLVLGSGAGGKLLAWQTAKSGRRCAVVERKLIGGSCPNTNCLPSKNEIWSAKVADLVHHAHRFGMVTGPVATDMKKVLARKRDMVDGLIALHLDQYRASGAELIMGTGRFTAPKTIEVSLNDGGTRVLTGDRVAINIGTRATIPDVPGLAAAKPLTNVEALELDRLPDHLVVIGGGYVGLELAQAYRRFGSHVTIIETGSQLASREDSDLAAALLEMLRDEDIAVHLGAKILGVQGRSGQAVSLQLHAPLGGQTIEPAISWWQPDAPPIPPGSAWNWPVSPSMPMAISRSMTGSRRARPMSGRLASVRAAHNSRMCQRTTSVSSGTIWLGAIEPRATGSSPTACSLTLRWRGSA